MESIIASFMVAVVSLLLSIVLELNEIRKKLPDQKKQRNHANDFSKSANNGKLK